MMKRKILIINPNSTSSMTKGLENMLANTPYFQSCDLIFVNPTSGPTSINNEHDAEDSLPHCITLLEKSDLLTTCDAFLVACYSVHPLVRWLAAYFNGHATTSSKAVIGIFEASVLACTDGRIGEEARYGIVSTGKVWEEALSDGVLGMSREVDNAAQIGIQRKFAGVETTGLNATELHDLPKDLVDEKLKEATKRLVRRGGVHAICLGCAGMTGMDETIRGALEEELGYDEGEKVLIIDGVVEGVRRLAQE